MAQSSCQFEGTEDLPLPDDATVLRKRAEAPLAVGPQYTRALRQSPTQGEKAICNAENYAWFATVSLFVFDYETGYINLAILCNRSFTGVMSVERPSNPQPVTTMLHQGAFLVDWNVYSALSC